MVAGKGFRARRQPPESPASLRVFSHFHRKSSKTASQKGRESPSVLPVPARRTIPDSPHTSVYQRVEIFYKKSFEE